MNIFVLDSDINECAKAHTDKHLIKMILESTQLLSTACRLSGFDEGYRITHVYHPCSLWVRESIDNWLWLKKLVEALNKEYKYRYNKTVNHKSYDVAMALSIPDLPKIGLTEFPLVMPDFFKGSDVVKSYRSYYNVAKRKLLSWKKRNPPTWIKNIDNCR